LFAHYKLAGGFSIQNRSESRRGGSFFRSRRISFVLSAKKRKFTFFSGEKSPQRLFEGEKNKSISCLVEFLSPKATDCVTRLNWPLITSLVDIELGALLCSVSNRTTDLLDIILNWASLRGRKYIVCGPSSGGNNDDERRKNSTSLYKRTEISLIIALINDS
jgi:hypothetical protein